MPSIESENCGRSQSRNRVRKISSKITKKKPKTCPAIPTNAWSVSGTLPAMSEACTCAWLPMSNCSSSRWNASESRISATICGSAWMRSRNSRNSGIARASVITTPTTTRPRTVSVAARARLMPVRLASAVTGGSSTSAANTETRITRIALAAETTAHPTTSAAPRTSRPRTEKETVT